MRIWTFSGIKTSVNVVYFSRFSQSWAGSFYKRLTFLLKNSHFLYFVSVYSVLQSLPSAMGYQAAALACAKGLASKEKLVCLLLCWEMGNLVAIADVLTEGVLVWKWRILHLYPLCIFQVKTDESESGVTRCCSCQCCNSLSWVPFPSCSSTLLVNKS